VNPHRVTRASAAHHEWRATRARPVHHCMLGHSRHAVV